MGRFTYVVYIATATGGAKVIHPSVVVSVIALPGFS